MTFTASSRLAEIRSLEDWMENPPERTEWVDGKLVHKDASIWIESEQTERNGMTLAHSRVQARLARYWGNYKETHEPEGEVYTEPSCRTQKQGRNPDVAYLTPRLITEYGRLKILPQSFPLCAEVVSPTDFAEDVISKAQEYLQSGSEEVWLLFPDNQWIIIVTEEIRKVFISGEIVSTQKLLLGFSVAVDDLLK